METELPEETGSAGIRTDNVDMVKEPESLSTKPIAKMSPVQLGNEMKSDEQDIPEQEFQFARELCQSIGKVCNVDKRPIPHTKMPFYFQKTNILFSSAKLNKSTEVLISSGNL